MHRLVLVLDDKLWMRLPESHEVNTTSLSNPIPNLNFVTRHSNKSHRQTLFHRSTLFMYFGDIGEKCIQKAKCCPVACYQEVPAQ